MKVAAFLCLLALMESVISELHHCDNKIYCQGPILAHVAKAGVFKDSKTFVDMKLKKPANETLDAFDALLNFTHNNPSDELVKQFVDKYFEAGNELEAWLPPDFTLYPEFLTKISNETVREFASNLVKVWPVLGRKVKDEVKKHPEQYSLIPLPNGFIIPGGRFKEIYYWDTYWIIKGLLLSEMTETVKGILENFSSIVKKFGFIPNGSRIYYLDRSQPPLFTSMVHAYLEKTNDKAFLEDNIVLMDIELKHWLDDKTIQVNKNGKLYTLGHFISGSSMPRPESYREDVATCEVFPEKDRAKCYNELKSGAESGWDFSSRWLFDSNGGNKANLSHIQVSRLVQVDLNVMLCKSFRILKNFYMALGKQSKAMFWKTKEQQWKIAIEEVFYDKEDGVWYDYDTQLSKHRKYFFPINFAPLGTGILDAKTAKERGCNAAKYIRANGVDKYLGGIPTSLAGEEGQQWDLPNAWPPLQDDVISGLVSSGCEEAVQLAAELTKHWINAMIVGYQNNHQMYERYDANIPGKRGGGGEYDVQTGFGWTNGVALKLINSFYTDPSIEYSNLAV